MVNGISVGWADVYNWFLPGQFIEVSGLPDGYYRLETEADPNNTIGRVQREGQHDVGSPAARRRPRGDRHAGGTVAARDPAHRATSDIALSVG
jgi:hypothetical protein